MDGGRGCMGNLLFQKRKKKKRKKLNCTKSKGDVVDLKSHPLMYLTIKQRQTNFETPYIVIIGLYAFLYDWTVYKFHLFMFMNMIL